MRHPLLLVLLCQWLAAGAHAALGEDLNGVRFGLCGVHGGRTPLRESAALDRAVTRLAGGAVLRTALADAGYLASRSAALHVSAAGGEAPVRRLLASRYCATLTDPALREFGALRRGSDLWLVLAAPVSLPAPADAARLQGRILDLVNAARREGRRCGARYFPPVAPLRLNAALNAAALAHSREMARYGEFDHRGHDGSTPALRVRRAGYGAHRRVGENIAAGPMSAEEVADGWLHSPEHCENVMDGHFTQLGFGFAVDLYSESRVYWTELFAQPAG